MKHFIIGTAGHVDHGKSSLIRALTGIETDRLKEEKKRGITIELGFAYLDTPEGGRVGIVDVPGHERFIHNMLTGAGGIDLALLIVAADEGVMPQTVEHLDILSLLGIKRGLIVLSKTDLVDSDWVELAMEDVREACQNSFLADAPIFPVSSETGEGIEALRQAIFTALEGVPEKRSDGPARQPIDRVFTVEGFGTVVTGTVMEGQIAVGETLMLYPEAQAVRVRKIQVHGEDCDRCHAGQRAAINVAQVSKQEVLRGDVLATAESLDPSRMLDVIIQMLPNAEQLIKHNASLHFHAGARELLCRVRLLGTSRLEAGERAYARLHLEEAVALKFGDPFVLRFFSPVATLGGGRILDPAPSQGRIHDEAWAAHLAAIEKGEPLDRLILAIESQSASFAPLALAERRAGLAELSQAERQALRAAALEKQAILPIREGIDVGSLWLQKLTARGQRILAAFHQEAPHKLGMKRESFRTRLLPDAKIDYTDRLVDWMKEAGDLKEAEGLLALPDFVLSFSAEEEALMAEMEAIYQKEGYQPRDTSELLASLDSKLDKDALLFVLQERGRLIRLTGQMLMHTDYVEAAKAYVVATIQEEGAMKMASFRDHIGSSRKYALAILERFDRQKLTRMEGEARVLC